MTIERDMSDKWPQPMGSNVAPPFLDQGPKINTRNYYWINIINIIDMNSVNFASFN